eukprot:139628_1
MATTLHVAYQDTQSHSREDNSMLHPQNSIDDFFVPQKPLTRFFLFEKNIKIFHYDDIPIKINFTLILYILIAIGFTIIPSFLNDGEDLTSWIGFAVIVLLFQLLSVFLSILLHFWSLTTFIASTHSINVWAFGHIGYGYDYNKKKLQITSELLAPCSIHLIFCGALIAITFMASTISTSVFPILPMKDNLGTNVVNELWKNQAILFILTLFVPTYPFGLSRVIATSLYPSKNPKEITQTLLIPTIVFGLIFIGGGVYLWAPYILFPGIWCIYQFALIISAIKKKAINCLPLYQVLDEKWRSSDKSRKDSDVVDMAEHEFQAYRKSIVKQEQRERQASQLQTKPKHKGGNNDTSLDLDFGINHFDLGTSHKG